MKIGKFHIIRKDKHNLIVGTVKRRTADCPKGEYKEGDKYIYVLGYFDDLRQALWYLFKQEVLREVDKLTVEEMLAKIDKFKEELWKRVPEFKCSDDLKCEPRRYTEEQREASRKRMKKMHLAKARKKNLKRREE